MRAESSDGRARRTAFMALTLAMYATSLVLPAVSEPMGHERWVPGYLAVVYGTSWPWTIAWSANVVLLLGLVLFGARQYNLSLATGAGGLCLAWMSPILIQKPLSDFGPGFHVWWLTFVVLGVVSVVESAASRDEPIQNP